MRPILLVLLVLTAGAASRAAEVEVVLRGGQVLEGRSVIDRDGVYVLDQGPVGTLTIPAVLVREIRGSVTTVEPPKPEEPLRVEAEAPASSVPEIVSVQEGERAPPPAAPVRSPAEAEAPRETAPSPSSSIAPASDPTSETLASWYGEPYDGKPTASGEVFDLNALTAAHPDLPFGTVVRVTNLDNGQKVDVRINDRIPPGTGRTLVLSRAAAERLAMTGKGVVSVRVEVVGPSD